jgi:GNAT superfamily N-acetyltransferase
LPTVGTWTAPAPLAATHDLTTFESGEPALDHWLKTHALRNEGRGASRTYVVCNDDHVIGYYSLATGSICSEQAPGRIRRNMPNPIPVMLLGRLAIDRAWQRHGIGKALLRDAIFRTATVAQLVGVKALMVHALSESARRFYEVHGFDPSPTHPRTLFLPIALSSGELHRSTPHDRQVLRLDDFTVEDLKAVLAVEPSPHAADFDDEIP